jgi:hypothetical protein
VHIVQQKWIVGADSEGPGAKSEGRANGDRLVLICRCGGCGSRYRVERYEDALPIVEECRANAAAPRDGKGDAWWRKVAERIEAGYRGEVLA